MLKNWTSLTTMDFSILDAMDPVAVLVAGSIEQHGPHLPLSTDSVIGEGLLEKSLDFVPSEVVILKLPSLCMGSSPEHKEFPGTISYSPELLIENVVEIGSQVKECGVKRLVILNSHGGNSSALDIAAMRLRAEIQLLMVKVDYFRFPKPSQIDLPDSEWLYGLHGGALETSMMMHLKPELVRMGELRNNASWLKELAEGHRRLNKDRAVSFYWMASDLNPSGTVGDATLASSEIGEELVEYYSKCFSEVILDASEVDLSRLG